MARPNLGTKSLTLAIVGMTLQILCLFAVAVLIAQAWGVTAVILFAMLVGLAGAVALVQKLRRSDNRERLALYAARADYEHQALMRGDTRTGPFGRYQPPPV